MNPFLTHIKDLILNSQLTELDKQALLKSLSDADKQWTITDFKLDRTEKVKKTTAILLEETIEELEKKRRAVEAQNKELEIETALEKVRAVAMGMSKPEHLADICEILFKEFRILGFDVMRNAMINIHDDEHSSFVNYDYSDEIGKSITPLVYNIHPVIEKQIREIRSADDAFSETVFAGKDLEEWKKFRKERGEKDDPRIDDINGLHYYFYSIGNGSIGISTFAPIDSEKLALLKRFRNVFILAYQRYVDITNAAAQAREAKIQLALERVRARTMAMQKSEELEECAVLLFQQVGELGINAWSAGFSIWQDDDSSFVGYNTNPTGGIGAPFVIPLTEDVFFKTIREAKRRGEDFLVFESEGESLVETYRYMDMLPVVGEVMRGIVSSGYELPKYQVTHCGFFPEGHLMFITLEPHPEAWDIFKRFTKVFEQTYTRFLDLKKSEAQAREAKIEAALERVRSRSMAMQKSGELKDVIQVVFDQFIQLDINIGHTGFVIDYKERDDYVIWIADPLGVPSQLTIPYFDSVYYNQFNEAKEKGLDFFATNLSFEEKNRFYQKLFEYVPGLSEEAKNFYFSCPGLAASTVLLENIGLYIENFTRTPYTDEENAILMRFGKVFQQTYTRFLDLQKAESQAREAKIEAALERTRTQSMLMQHSNELDDALRVFHEQVLLLGIHSEFSFLWLPDEDKDRHIFWAAWAEDISIDPLAKKGSSVFKSKAIDYPLERDEPATAQCLVDWKGIQSVVSYHVPPAGVESYFAAWQELVEGAEQLKPEYFSDGLYYVEAFMKYGCFGVMIRSELPEEEKKILNRFAIEFERTYTRFLDLQKAEAQAREAKVEAALEKVRSRTMAMQRSSELADVATVLFQQVKALGIPQWSCGFNIWEIGDKEFTFYPGSPDGDILPPCKVPLTEDYVFILFDESRRRGDELCIYESKGEIQKEHYRYMHNLPGGLGDLLQSMLDTGLTFPDFQIDHIANFSHGNLLFITYEHFPEMHDVFKRFAKVFDQTYTRFLDLQKAESQAREAQIESALEKVRSRTMAMQHSDELGDAAFLLFQQVKILGEKLFGCGFNIWDEDKKAATAWMAAEDRIQPPFKTSSSEDVFQRIFEAEQNGERLFVEEMRGEVNQTHYRYMLSIPDFRKIVEQFNFPIPEFQIIHCAFFSQGYLMFISFEPVPEAHDLFMRFAKVFEQTYTRFLDLKKAEALAKEALKQASLDRIRGQVASMRSAEDLEHIIPMLWHELSMLNVPFIRCGLFIMNEAESIVNVYLSSPDGKSLGLLHLPFDAGGVTQNAVEHWRKKKVYKEHWNKEEFIAWMQTLIASGQVHDSSTYQGSVAPPESLYLHFVPFKQGMIYVGSAEALHHDTIELLKTLASTFSIAYSRYEDFRLLEDAKNRIETTLDELKATQSQLVQSEKMASLGELTAGIAHEIQNPLNFVNNFSELSNELIEEMAEEMAKGNKEEVDSIISDLRSNLEKINQHGRRADSIVKGMLQHSRASTGEKEPTDINALADEYLRLAYHGFRAKEKSFNAILETELDKSIGQIKAVPQELGRVLLNLYNNAFYAVNEKSKLPGFEPKVRLTTSKNGSSILIVIQDNGKGIPEKVREKIFQPFFTTKPTGQGTGLGLSLSYDIVKAHGGEFKVDSIEGDGTTFTVLLPI
ncbi:MAG TPA: ATP-binding protein [Chitinophagaceae bacterium]|nr:ATP-binding protein [Chitinophagaceae bacterium]